MLIMDVVRGKHATGVAGVTANGEWRIAKAQGDPFQLLDTKRYDNVLRQQNWVLLGHNRHATKGALTARNAHPFSFDNVVGMHNGTIRGQHRLIDHQEFEVDSENIYHSIQQIGLEETLKVLDGAYALTYYDDRDDTLVLLRNKERPLFYAFTEDGKTLFWASEPWMIHVSCMRENIKIRPIVNLRENTIYRFKIDKKPNGDPIEFTTETFTPFVAPVTSYTSYYGGSGGYSANSFRKQTQQEGKAENKKGEKKGASAGLSEEQKRLNDYINATYKGHTVVFEFICDAKNSLGQEYMSCVLKGSKDEFEVRIHVSKQYRPEVHEAIKAEVDCLFEGCVTVHGTEYVSDAKGKTYLVIDPNSVKPVELFEEDDEGFQTPAQASS